MSEERMLPTHTDVLVIGQGPVGTALGCLLGRQGVAAVEVDKALDILHMPRAIALDNEALRILQMAGLDESAFARIPIPEVRMTCPQVGLFNRVNTEGHIDGHPKLVTFYQPELERALRDEMAGHAGVSAFAGWELMSFAESGDLVSARLRNLQGEEQVVTARYLVGADGASSRIRTLIGQDFQGQTYSEDWLIVDAARREGKAIDHVEHLELQSDRLVAVRIPQHRDPHLLLRIEQDQRAIAVDRAAMADLAASGIIEVAPAEPIAARV